MTRRAPGIRLCAVGTLLHASSGRRIPLAARTIAGRSVACGLRVEARLASKEHALLSWSGRSWSIRDLDSTNGTYVDEVCLPPGGQRGLKAGARLAFGSAEDVWVVEDDGPPSLFAIELGSRAVALPVDGVLSLGSPEGVVALAALHGPSAVLLDLEGEARPLDPSGVVRVGSSSWWVLPPEPPGEGTPLASSVTGVAAVSFHFSVPRNEEGVSLAVVFGGGSIDLPAREHIYLLLILARARLADRDRPVGERGWVHRDRLMSMLAWEESAIRVAIHRARAQLSAAGLPDPESLVESRRPFLRRFGSDRIQVISRD